jgi:hypothetical protein
MDPARDVVPTANAIDRSMGSVLPSPQYIPSPRRNPTLFRYVELPDMRTVPSPREAQEPVFPHQKVDPLHALALLRLPRVIVVDGSAPSKICSIHLALCVTERFVLRRVNCQTKFTVNGSDDVHDSDAARIWRRGRYYDGPRKIRADDGERRQRRVSRWCQKFRI